MAYSIENPYFDKELEEVFQGYEIEGIRKIKQLSRQLRTFFNYKMELARFRFRSDQKFSENHSKSKFFSQKQKIELLSYDLINGLKNLNILTQTIEEGIHNLLFNNDKLRYYKLSEITENIIMLIHYFSEENIIDHPRFLKFINILSKNILLVKKCLIVQFYNFYEEHNLCYKCLEVELEFFLDKKLNTEIINTKKRFEEILKL